MFVLLILLIIFGIVYSEKSIKQLEDALNAATLKYTGEFIIETNGSKDSPYFCYFAKDASTKEVIKLEDGPASSTSADNKKYKLNLSSVKNGDALYGLKSGSSAKWKENINNNFPDNPEAFIKELGELKNSMKFTNKVSNSKSEPEDIDFKDDEVIFTFKNYCGLTTPKIDLHITVSLKDDDSFGTITSYDESTLLVLAVMPIFTCDKDDNCIEKMEKFTDEFVKSVQGSIKTILIILGVVFGIVIVVVIVVIIFKYKKKSKF